MVGNRKPRALKAPAKLRQAVIVLGMHRSGTSALAGTLGHMGCDLPKDLMAPADMNEKGFFESNRITGLNDELLSSAGFKWFSFPPFPNDWLSSAKADEFVVRAIEELKAAYGRSHLFIMKDPRMCRLLPFWKRALGEVGYRPLYVCTHRHPLDVATSLNRWADYEPNYGILLWLRHVLDAEIGSRGHPRVFVSYDQLMTDWETLVTRIAAGLSISWPRQIKSAAPAVEDFLSGDLRHFSQGADRGKRQHALPDWVRQVLNILEKWAATGEDIADHPLLDTVREAFDRATPVFENVTWRSQELWHETRQLQRKSETLSQSIEEARSTAAAHETNHITEQKARGELETRVAHLKAALDAASAEASAFKVNHAAEQKARGEFETRVAHLQSALDEASTEAAVSKANHAAEQRVRSELETRITDLRTALDEASAEASAFKTNHAVEQKMRGELETRVADLHSALDEATAEASATKANQAAEQRVRGELETRITDLRAALDEATAEASAFKTNHAAEQKARSELETRITDLRTALDEASAEASAFKTNHAAEQKARGELETRVADLHSALDEATAEASATKANQAAEQRVRSELETRITDLRAALDEATAEASAFKTNHAAEQKMRGELETRITKLQAALEQSDAQAAAFKANHASEQQARLAATKDAEVLRLTYAAVTREEEARELRYADELAKLRSQLHASETRNGALSDDIAITRQNIEDLRCEKEALEATIANKDEERLAAERARDQLESALIQRRHEIEELYDQQAEREALIVRLNAALDQLKNAHAGLEKRHKHASGHLAQMTRRLTALMKQDLAERMGRASKERAERDAQAETERVERNARAERDLADQKKAEQIQALENTLEKLRAQSSQDTRRFSDEIAQMTRRKNELDASIVTREKALASERARVATQAVALAKLNAELKETVLAQNSATKQIRTLQADLLTRRTVAARERDTIEKLTANLKYSMAELAKLSSERQTSTGHIQNLEGQLTAAQINVAQQHDALESLSSELENSRGLLMARDSEFGMAMRRIDQLQATRDGELDMAMSRIEQLERELADSRAVAQNMLEQDQPDLLPVTVSPAPSNGDMESSLDTDVSWASSDKIKVMINIFRSRFKKD